MTLKHQDQAKKIFDGVLRNCNNNVYNEFTEFLPDLKNVIDRGHYNEGTHLILPRSFPNSDVV